MLGEGISAIIIFDELESPGYYLQTKIQVLKPS